MRPSTVSGISAHGSCHWTRRDQERQIPGHPGQCCQPLEHTHNGRQLAQGPGMGTSLWNWLRTLHGQLRCSFLTKKDCVATSAASGSRTDG